MVAGNSSGDRRLSNNVIVIGHGRLELSHMNQHGEQSTVFAAASATFTYPALTNHDLSL